MSNMSFFGLASLAVERLGVRADRPSATLEVVGVVDERDLDAQLRQRVVEQVVGAAVERRAGHDVVAGLGDVEDRERLGGLAGADHQRAGQADGGGDATLEARQPGLERTLGGVHDAGVDVADLGEREQVLCVRGVAELEAGGLVDRHPRGSDASRTPTPATSANPSLVGTRDRAGTLPRGFPTQQVGILERPGKRNWSRIVSGFEKMRDQNRTRVRVSRR
jgi:hypothetical protein